MSREKLKAIHELSERLSVAMPENKVSFYAIAYAISLYVDKALGIEKSPARDPNDVDMGR